jgi:hypothetical protein
MKAEETGNNPEENRRLRRSSQDDAVLSQGPVKGSGKVSYEGFFSPEGVTKEWTPVAFV